MHILLAKTGSTMADNGSANTDKASDNPVLKDSYKRIYQEVKMTRQEQIVREVLEMWTRGPNETIQTWRDHCLPDFIWWNAGRGAVNGLEAACKKIEAMHEHLHFHALKVPIKNFMSAGNVVIQERVDELYDEAGNLLYAIPVVGVVEFEGDKIKEWRDYCDDWVLKKTLKEQQQKQS